MLSYRLKTSERFAVTLENDVGLLGYYDVICLIKVAKNVYLPQPMEISSFPSLVALVPRFLESQPFCMKFGLP